MPGVFGDHPPGHALEPGHVRVHQQARHRGQVRGVVAVGENLRRGQVAVEEIDRLVQAVAAAQQVLGRREHAGETHAPGLEELRELPGTEIVRPVAEKEHVQPARGGQLAVVPGQDVAVAPAVAQAGGLGPPQQLPQAHQVVFVHEQGPRPAFQQAADQRFVLHHAIRKAPPHVVHQPGEPVEALVVEIFLEAASVFGAQRIERQQELTGFFQVAVGHVGLVQPHAAQAHQPRELLLDQHRAHASPPRPRARRRPGRKARSQGSPGRAWSGRKRPRWPGRRPRAAPCAICPAWRYA